MAGRKKTGKAGRPKLENGKRARMQLRVTYATRDRWKLAAKKAGKTFTEWAESKLNAAAHRENTEK